MPEVPAKPEVVPKVDDSLSSALDSFYSDIAAIESTGEVPSASQVVEAEASAEPPQQSKKKKKVNCSSNRQNRL